MPCARWTTPCAGRSGPGRSGAPCPTIGWDGAKKRTGSKTHVAVDTLGHVLALLVTPVKTNDRAVVADLTAAVRAETGHTVEVAFIDDGSTGPKPATAARSHGIELVVVNLPEAKRGVVLLPRRWVVERHFGWAARFRRLASDDERVPETVAGLHFVAFVCLMAHQLVAAIAQSPYEALEVYSGPRRLGALSTPWTILPILKYY